MAAQTIPIIAIDGPSGSGKGTICRLLADTLSWHLLDSGALYRVTGIAARQLGLPLDDQEALAEVAASLAVEFAINADGSEQILLSNQDITAQVRAETCAADASVVAALPAVRSALLARQRAFVRAPGLIADGRDMGTKVFPAAKLKVFLTASAQERAKRRHKQLKDNNIDVSLAALSRDIAERDERDSKRAVAPLVPASDAKILDSTSMTIDAVVATILAWKNQTFGIHG